MEKSGLSDGRIALVLVLLILVIAFYWFIAKDMIFTTQGTPIHNDNSNAPSIQPTS